MTSAGIVVGGDVAAVIEHHDPGAGDLARRATRLAREQQAILASPADRDRDLDRGAAGEGHRADRRQRGGKPGRVGQAPEVGGGVGRRHPGRVRDRRAEGDLPGGPRAQQPVGPRGQPAGDGVGQAQVGMGGEVLGAVGKAGGGQGGRRAHQAAAGHLERDQAAERVAGHVRTLDPELAQERAHQADERIHAGGGARRGHRRGTEAGQVQRDHIPVGLQARRARAPTSAIGCRFRGSGPAGRRGRAGHGRAMPSPATLPPRGEMDNG